MSSISSLAFSTLPTSIVNKPPKPYSSCIIDFISSWFLCDFRPGYFTFKPSFSNLSAKNIAFSLCFFILMCSVLRFLRILAERKLSIVGPRSIHAPLFTFLVSSTNSCEAQYTPPTVSLLPLINLVKL